MIVTIRAKKDYTKVSDIAIMPLLHCGRVSFQVTNLRRPAGIVVLPMLRGFEVLSSPLLCCEAAMTQGPKGWSDWVVPKKGLGFRV